MSSDTAIRVQNLGKCYNIYAQPKDRLKQALYPKVQRASRMIPEKKYYKEFWALRDISFEIKKGERIGIIGKNGSGKSTLLQLIAGTLTPTTGTVEVNGRVAALLELGSGFNQEFTGKENIFHNGAILGISNERMKECYEDIVAFADIGDFIDRPLKTYSTGMRMRLAFAVATHVDPDILIIDEALSVGDAFFSFKCLSRLDQLIEQRGASLLFVSHDVGTVKRFCGRAIYLKNGETASAGMVKDVAEMFWLDVRDEQKRGSAGNKSLIGIKPSLGENIAFGSDDGAFSSVFFSKTSAPHAVFDKGEKIVLSIECQWKNSISRSLLTVIINDHQRMTELCGDTYTVTGTAGRLENMKSNIKCSFLANFYQGRYSISLRLEELRKDGTYLLVEKQAGILIFDVHDTSGVRAGYLNVKMNFEEGGIK